MHEGKVGFAYGRSEAELRVKRAQALFESITETLNTMLEEVRSGNMGPVRKIAGKQAELETAIKDCSRHERSFNEKFGSGAFGDDIDFDALRSEIGCRLDRLRRCR